MSDQGPPQHLHKLLQNKIRSANKSFLGKMVDKKNTLESASAAPRLPNQQSPLSKLAALPKVWGEGCEESEDHEDQDCGVQGGVKRGKVSGRNRAMFAAVSSKGNSAKTRTALNFLLD
ncbi:uncharacterized protein FFNC_02037 [Fusarium fujikuroi]|nr:uncharacterized protein FFC1_02577 [Fusarium fujikuroi]SCO31345.1 uncharacterized protein FFNC_02037 [Fusarium fujikuroi]